MATPPNRLSRLPCWLSHWLGYRPPSLNPSKPTSIYLTLFWSFLGAFGGLSVLQAIFGYSAYFVARGVPGIVASYGASAVLCYGAIEAPFSQPRALVFGHFISALVGVCVAKLFHLLPEEVPEGAGQITYHDVEWLCASLSAAVAVVLMQITKTTHPPAGATALLPATSPEIWVIGWYYLPVVLLSSVMILVTALAVDNVQRRYPVFWWTPVAPVQARPVTSESESSSSGKDIEANEKSEGK